LSSFWRTGQRIGNEAGSDRFAGQGLSGSWRSNSCSTWTGEKSSIPAPQELRRPHKQEPVEEWNSIG
jgi:hypothetical protein